jgi:hypothetical protein
MKNMKTPTLFLASIAALLLMQLAHAQTTQPTPMPATPMPANAVVLFDGTQASLDNNWTYRDGKPVGWTVADGVATSKHMDIITKKKFGDFQLHVEFCEPLMGPEVKGQGKQRRLSARPI